MESIFVSVTQIWAVIRPQIRQDKLWNLTRKMALKLAAFSTFSTFTKERSNAVKEAVSKIENWHTKIVPVEFGERISRKSVYISISQSINLLYSPMLPHCPPSNATFLFLTSRVIHSNISQY